MKRNAGNALDLDGSGRRNAPKLPAEERALIDAELRSGLFQGQFVPGAVFREGRWVRHDR